VSIVAESEQGKRETEEKETTKKPSPSQLNLEPFDNAAAATTSLCRALPPQNVFSGIFGRKSLSVP
jgi:hypothetical protein